MASETGLNDVVFVSFSAEITPHTTEGLIAVMSDLANQGAAEVHLLLSTPGGSVSDGITLYNTLRGLPFGLVTHNVGSVDSIGSAVFLAGERRYACPNSTFAFHGVSIDGAPGMTRHLLEERLGGLRQDEKRIADVIVACTSLERAEVESWFLQGQTKDAPEAQRLGIVHDIADVRVPRGAQTFALAFQRP